MPVHACRPGTPHCVCLCVAEESGGRRKIVSDASEEGEEKPSVPLTFQTLPAAAFCQPNLRLLTLYLPASGCGCLNLKYSWMGYRRRFVLCVRACVRACVIACVRACVQPPATNKHTLVGKVAVWRKQLCCALFVLWIAKHSQRTKASVFLYDFRRTCCGKSRKGDPPRRPSCGCASARGSASPSTFIFPIIIFNKLWSNLYAEIQLQAACFKLHSSFVQIAFNMHSKCLQS